MALELGLDPHLLQELARVYQELLALPEFPHPGDCQGAAIQLRNELGLEKVDGFFLLDRPRKLHGDYYYIDEHAWSKDRNGTVFDLTAPQFNPWLNLHIQPGVLIITPEDSLFKRYLSRWVNPLDYLF